MFVPQFNIRVLQKLILVPLNAYLSPTFLFCVFLFVSGEFVNFGNFLIISYKPLGIHCTCIFANFNINFHFGIYILFSHFYFYFSECLFVKCILQDLKYWIVTMGACNIVQADNIVFIKQFFI